MNTKRNLWTSLLVSLVIAGFALASNVTLPHTFQPNTPARASEVNANFSAVKTSVDDNYSRITTLESSFATSQDAGASLASTVTGLEARVTALEQPCTGSGPNDVMIQVGTLCVDKYEASVWSAPAGTGTRYGTTSADYPSSFPANGAWTTKLYAASVPTGVPSSYLTWYQAAQACAAAGKRLPTNAEWQTFAGGAVPDTRTNCNLNATAKAAPGVNCESGWGIVNTTGNVAEFTADWVTGNAAAWSPGGIQTLSGTYGNNWQTGMQRTADTSGEGMPNVIIRGGDYTHYRGTSSTVVGGGSSAGPWRLWAETPPSLASAAFGFRCVK